MLRRRFSRLFSTVPFPTVALSLCLGAVPLTVPHQAKAQVVYSLGVQEVYDSNIFLEDDGITPPAFFDENGMQIPPPKSFDGKTNDSTITNVSLGVASALPLGRKVKGAVDATLGGLFFASESDEDRITLDSLVKLDAAEGTLPRKLSLGVASNIQSGSQSVNSAQGTASKQSATHTASLSVGVGEFEIANATDIDFGYNLSRRDFLGELLFSSRPSDNDFQKVEGADYFSHSLNSAVTHHASQTLDLGLGAAMNYLDYTAVSSNDPNNTSTKELDRIDWGITGRTSYIPSAKLQIAGQVGVDFSSYANDPNPVPITVTNDDGTTSVINPDRNGTESSLRFGVDFNYSPNLRTLVQASVLQSAGNDVDGDRVTTRTVGLNLSRTLGDRVSATAGGSYSQFTDGNSLSQSTERFELTLALSYNFTESISLNAGWNYAQQDAGTSNEARISGDQDYTVHRAFIGLSGGLVGLTS